MSSQTNELAASSIEDVLAGALWVSSLTDPSLSLDRLHETFMEVIFSFVPADGESTGDAGSPQSRLRTAADREREQRRKEELRLGLQELQGGPAAEERDMISEEDEEVFDEEDDDDADSQQDEDFLRWIHAGHEQPAPSQPEDHTVPVKAIELELSRVGLGEDQVRAAEEALPERLGEIARRDKRPGLGPKTLPGGYSYQIPLDHEAYWILRQLRRAGQPLAHNADIGELANRPLSEIVDNPVIVAISYALQKMTREYVEPAHLMLYHQTALHPLLRALLDDSPLEEAAKHSVPVASYAYCTATGRRQRPFISGSYVGFGALSTRSIGDGDAAWRHLSGVDFTQRKPCFLELGRLLVRILELDSMCHKLEYRRQQMLIMMKDNPEARVQDQRVLLEGEVFERAVDADLWHTFVQSVAGVRSRGAYHTVRSLGLEDTFEEYSITGLQYQENLINNAPINMCPPQRMPLLDWAAQVGSKLQPPRHGEIIISLFNNAIVDQFSKLPYLCKHVIDLFSAQGDLIVTYKRVKRRDDIFPLATFFVEHPRHYLELVEMEHQGAVDLHYVIDENLVRRSLNINQLYQRHVEGDQWCNERERAMELLVVRLVDSVIPKIKAELLYHARYQVDVENVERLGVLCAQGPYEPTALRLEAYTEDAFTWDPEWNVVESLPTRDATTGRTQARVCSAYQGDNGVTFFSFLDEYGNVIASTRWTDCATNSMVGREAAYLQSIQLEKLFLQFTPSVVALGASGPLSLQLLQTIRRFLRERVHRALGVSVPVVWVSPEVSRFYSATRFADLEFPNADHLTRTSVALGRYLQDPFNAISVLFDAKRTALQLFVSGTRMSREQEDQLYQRLSWEMSLWAASIGFWTEDCMKRPNSVATLQFIPGLGLPKAQRLTQALAEVPPSSRGELMDTVAETFGDQVAKNIGGTIRVAAPNSFVQSQNTTWNVLDATLIPLEWYDITGYIASTVAHADGSAACSFTAILSLIQEKQRTKRVLLDKHANQKDFFPKLKALKPKGWDSLPGEREMELLVDEVIANGQSYQRRPYRRISSRELMQCVTGVSYITSEEFRALRGNSVSDDDMLSSAFGSFVVKEGDYVAGTVGGVRGGTKVGIRMTTSRGLNAFIAAEDIEDENTRLELLQHVRFLESMRQARKDGQPIPDVTYDSPEWLRRGALLQGTIHRCDWLRCELRLKWCAPRDFDIPATSEDHNSITSYSAMMKDAASSVNSLKTVQMMQDGLVFATKVSRHPLFRDISSAKATEWMRDKEIGEVLLRPATGRRNRAVCVVKLGNNCICNWVISEDRRPNGNIYYRLTDSVVEMNHEFDEVDEFLRNFIDPMVSLVMTIRHHRRFVDNARDVASSLAEQVRSGHGFAYAFIESGTGRPPIYHVVTSDGSSEYRFRLHVTDHSVFVRLPLHTTGSTGQYKWVECRNAEHVSQIIKQHAIQNS